MVRVLVVDDDGGIRDALRAALEDEGYEVAEAPDGEVALAYLRAKPDPTVVLTDYKMPRCNGAQFLRIVAADPALVSRHAYALMAARPEKQLGLPDELRGMLAVPPIEKPFDLDDLLAAVAEAARRLEGS